MREHLLQTLSQLSEQHPEWLVHDMSSQASSAGEDVAVFWMGQCRRVWVTLLEDVAPTDVIRQGLLAHQKMLDRPHPDASTDNVNLLVMPALKVQHPIVLSTKVVITNLIPEGLTLGMHGIAQRCHGTAV